jgi:hypothetical protein
MQKRTQVDTTQRKNKSKQSTQKKKKKKSENYATLSYIYFLISIRISPKAL